MPFGLLKSLTLSVGWTCLVRASPAFPALFNHGAWFSWKSYHHATEVLSQRNVYVWSLLLFRKQWLQSSAGRGEAEDKVESMLVRSPELRYPLPALPLLLLVPPRQ